MKTIKKIIWYTCTTVIICIIGIWVQIQYGISKEKNFEENIQRENTYEFLLENYDGSECNNLKLKSVENKFNYKVKFINDYDDSKFMLCAYIDYKQIEFSPNNEGLTNCYRFNVNKHNSIEIPIEFDTSQYTDGRHILNFVIYPKVEDEIINDKENSKFAPIVSIHDLIINSEDEINREQILNVGTYEGDNEELFKFELKTSNEELSEECMSIDVNSNEVIKLPLKVGKMESVDDYLFFYTLDGVEELIDDKYENYYFKLSTGEVMKKDVMLKVPSKKGSYKLIGFIILNPWSKVSDEDSTNPTYIENSDTFTINVK